ncbi:MAG: xanthine dehydrogenase, molybdenum binding subunit apoprotein, partial [Tardiphaga sp.]|nr:xanthine dehydrogenase, molybdenum binding subunit apoprotein [Tardiphaga sp.]
MTAHTKGSGTTWVGRSIRRVEDPALVTGQGRFTADLPAVHWVRFVRSSVAAGTIQGINAPDGAGIVTSADLKALKPIRPMLSKFNYVAVGQPILADGVVRFTGEAIAAVYAPGKDQAEDLADQVEVEISETTALIDSMDALVDGAPLVHDEAKGNVIVEGRIKTPGFDDVWTTAHKVLRVDGRSRRQNATPMEARAGHAVYDASTGRVTLTCTTQMPHLTRTAVCDIIGMPESDLRVIAPDVGGGFGQKMSLAPEYVLLVWLARKLRSSVSWTEDRRENRIASFHSRDQHV